VCSVRLSVKVAVASVVVTGHFESVRSTFFQTPVSPMSLKSPDVAWPRSTVKFWLALSTEQVFAKMFPRIST
jgi:hypothetical protein